MTNGRINADQLRSILEKHKVDESQTKESIEPYGTVFKMNVSRNNRIKVPNGCKFVPLETSGRKVQTWGLIVPFGHEAELLATVNLDKINVPDDYVKSVTGVTKVEFQTMISEIKFTGRQNE